jgi:hypothetical protein
VACIGVLQNVCSTDKGRALAGGLSMRGHTRWGAPEVPRLVWKPLVPRRVPEDYTIIDGTWRIFMMIKGASSPTTWLRRRTSVWRAATTIQ